MSFTPGIPMSGQSLGQTRDPIRNNFTNYNDLVSVNHFAPNDANQGKHTFSEYVVQAQSPATATNEVATYSRLGNSVPQLFLQQQNQLAGASDIQMSRLDVGVKSATNGYTFLPGGVILQWGIGQFAGTASNVNILFVTSNVNFPANCYNVLLTGIGFDNTFDVTNVSQTGFTASRSLGTFGANQQFFWQAIGN